MIYLLDWVSPIIYIIFDYLYRRIEWINFLSSMNRLVSSRDLQSSLLMWNNSREPASLWILELRSRKFQNSSLPFNHKKFFMNFWKRLPQQDQGKTGNMRKQTTSFISLINTALPIRLILNILMPMTGNVFQNIAQGGLQTLASLDSFH